MSRWTHQCDSINWEEWWLWSILNHKMDTCLQAAANAWHTSGKKRVNMVTHEISYPRISCDNNCSAKETDHHHIHHRIHHHIHHHIHRHVHLETTDSNNTKTLDHPVLVCLPPPPPVSLLLSLSHTYTSHLHTDILHQNITHCFIWTHFESFSSASNTTHRDVRCAPLPLWFKHRLMI